ncbi:serine hydrolase domain-containing protein [Polaribacter dokdonensis]|uniref:Beta-lactamase n=1 Tax=Polaribacter dokdonensis DSW-5 TaxID=1300348 RepID=A0A0N1IYA2_9FLAO|nr:serine hydrolase domain-containing protein [Polaribacter dokdonensis]KOY53137.1 Beta-lactamase [Polaribacter dokdonensis DSW-5]SEE57604.1 CubicO group peptidase, beta-lactamase class C family [Polaribacter dokdonensis DSW-5]
MNKIKILIFLISIIFFTSCQNKNNPKTTDLSEISINQIDTLMEVSYERGLFNGNILVAQSNTIIYQNEFGYSDASRSKKLSKNSIFNIGSIAKEFNAVAIMILKERGSLHLEDKLSKFDLQLPNWSNKVTIKHLLQYSSGLPKVKWNSVKNDKDIYTDIKNIDNLIFEPGSDYLYSNNNIFLQRRIVEKVSGMSFNDFIQENILIPSKMSDAIIDATSKNTQLVTSFNNDLVNDSSGDIEFSGWVFPSISDMFNWVNSLHSGKIISKESLMLLFDSFSKNSESALGKGVFKNNELMIYQHQGSSFNYESLIHYNLKEDVMVILMTNNKNLKLRNIAEAIENITKGNSFKIPQKSVYLSIRQKCYNNVDDGIEYYKQLKKNYPDTYNFSEEGELNRLGYKLIEKNQIEDAIKIFKLLVSEFPNSANPYDSLGEAYYLNGNNSMALQNYNKVLELNSNNTNAKKMIKKNKMKN